jgi:hypothetical protein
MGIGKSGLSTGPYTESRRDMGSSILFRSGRVSSEEDLRAKLDENTDDAADDVARST